MSKELTFTQKVAKIQQTLKAPKNQKNKFGNYNYRNQEDILEALKPLLGDLVLTISDEMVQVGNRIYVKATATITDGTNSLSNTAYAREADEQKGMSESQLTGSCSSYARKYCLNGLFLIDDTKDADTEEFQGKKQVYIKPEMKPAEKETPKIVNSKGEELKPPSDYPKKQYIDKKEEPKPEVKKTGWGSKKPTTNNAGDLY